MTKAIFEGLVFDERNNCAPVAYVGADPTYVIVEDGFRFHVDAWKIDEQIVSGLRDQVSGNRDEVGISVLRMMGRDDLFTKAAVMAALANMDAEFLKLRDTGLPLQAREYLGMMGFRVIVNRHGDIVSLTMPTPDADDEP
jgi:hypothetical protein